MVLSREDFKKILFGMKAVYTDPKFLPDRDSIDVWYVLLQDIPYPVLNLATQKYIMTHKFSPTIADIREIVAGIVKKENEGLTEVAAWDMVKKAISRSAYYSEEEFEKLPETVKRTIHSPAYLREMAITEDLNLSVESSNFMRSYRKVCEEMKEEAQMPAEVKEAIKRISGQTAKEISDKRIKN